MSKQWFKLLAEGLTCPREQGPKKVKKILGECYESRLEGAKTAMEARFKANDCPKARKEDFKILANLGKGACASVYLTEYLKDHKTYALKVVKKGATTPLNKLIIREKKLMRAVQFKFIAELHFVFQDFTNFYLVMDSAPRGDLLQLIFRTTVTEIMLKWYAAQIILAVEYLHECDITHRDLKPPNMLIFEDCHLKISDFGFAKILDGPWDETYTFCGTRPYMAPEVILRQPYGKYVDWWSVGVTLYQTMYRGRVPYFGGYNPEEDLRFPKGVDIESPFCDLISRLIQPRRSRRLGCLLGGEKAIFKHAWFFDISFPDVFAKKPDYAPWLPPMRRPEPSPYDLQTESGEPDHGVTWYNSFCSQDEDDRTS